MFDPNDLIARLPFVIVLLLSLTVHEWAHAISAYRLGDDTASRMGRLTLNPIPHIDPIGTLLLPMLGVPFGWAKPVPVDVTRFDRKVNMRTGMMITASAGPASNVVLAVVCMTALGVLSRMGPVNPAVPSFLWLGYKLNVLLAIFNMLPVIPLDGSRVADGLMPHRFRPTWDRFVQFGYMPLAAVIMLPHLFDVSLFTVPLRIAVDMANHVIFAIATF